MNSRIEKYLNYIINDLITNTKFQESQSLADTTFLLFFKLPWSNNRAFTEANVKGILRYNSIPLGLVDYLYDNYVLEDDNQIDYVWEKYKDFLIDIVYNKKTINESDDKMGMYLDKLLNILEDDTYLVNSSVLKVPFYNTSISFRRSDEYIFILDLVNLSSPPDRFITYCSDMFNIEGKNLKILWDNYRLFLGDFVTNNTRY
jgi:hypothetical protein